MISKKTGIIIFLAILALFIGTRVAGLHISYQQDEIKLPNLFTGEQSVSGGIPHPPLMEFLFSNAGHLVGATNFRMIPFALALVNIFLLFYLAKIIFDTRTALWTVFLFSIVYFSLIASLMLGVDGEFMPFFFLVSAIAYYKIRDKNFVLKGNWLFVFMFIIGIVGGVLTKVSTVLPIGAFALDFGIETNIFKDAKRTIRYALIGLGTLVLLSGILYLSKYVFTFFDIDKALVYWKHFANSSSFLDRGWLQTFIQFWKCIMYASPLIILPLFFVDKEIWKKTRPLFLFVGIGIVFYLFVFDFSLGAIDMYLQFLVVPLCIITAAAFSKYIGSSDIKEHKNKILVLLAMTLLIFRVQFLPHVVPPMYPKIEWLSRVLSFKWNFLFPFTGGSGPVPFYVSFLFIAVSWAICAVFIVYYLKVKRLDAKKLALMSILIFGLMYNFVFVEEYLFGRINGSTETLIHHAAAYIKANDSIKKVLVYNDNGGFEIHQLGKYERRIYAVPSFEDAYKPILANFKGHVLSIEIPKIAENSLYKKYFDSCKVIYTETSRHITSKIYDCTKSFL